MEQRYPWYSEEREVGRVLCRASVLQSWAAAMADYNSGSSRQNLASTNGLILVDDFGPPSEQCAHFALARDGRFDGRLAEPDDAMRGYSLYDALPRISGLRFEIEQNGETFTYDSGELPGLTNGVADRLDLVLQLSGKTGETIDRKSTRLNSSH